MVSLTNLKLRVLFLSVLCFLSFNSVAQSEGEQIFKSVCAACHSIGEGKLIGPDAKEWMTSERFTSTEDPEGTLIKYVQNPAAFGVIEMPAQALSADEIKAVLNYVNEYVPEEKPVAVSSDLSEEEEDNAISNIYIYIIVLLLLIFILTSVKNSLKESLSQPTETVLGLG